MRRRRPEFRDEVAYLLTHASPNVAKRFVLSTMEAVQRVRRFPESGSTIGGARRTRIEPFTCDLIYLSETSDIFIIAIAHHRRRPGYWLLRR
jgi:plasmid stabilization system protein ParE